MFRRVSARRNIPATEFYISALVLLLLEAFLLYQFFAGPQLEKASAARAEYGGRKAALDVFRAEKKDSEGRQAQLAALQSQIDDSEILLPQALHNEDLMSAIGLNAREKNIKIESIVFQERSLISPEDYIRSPDTEARLSALPKEGLTAQPSAKTLSLQGVQISFSAEFHTVGPFLNLFEDGGRKVRIKNVSVTRVQEGEVHCVLNLEYAALSPTAEQELPVIDAEGAPAGKDSLFRRYPGFIEDNIDPTILLLSEDENYDPDFYIVLRASASNETKVSYGVYPRVETELRSNVNNAVRAKLTINGDDEQFDYVYTLGSYQRSETRKLSAEGGVLRLKILSCQRMGDNDNVAVLLDVDNNTDLPFEIIVVNDDVLSPRFHPGIIKGDVNIVTR